MLLLTLLIKILNAVPGCRNKGAKASSDDVDFYTNYSVEGQVSIMYFHRSLNLISLGH